MRQSIILTNKFENLFVNEAEEGGFIKPIYNPADDLYSPQELNEAKMCYRNMLKGQQEERQNIFRILMLFDEIILPSVSQSYDYSKLKNLGLFNLYYFEDLYESDPIHQDGHIEYATYLKPAILPVYESRIRNYFQDGQAVNGFKSFVSDLYDWILLGKKLPTKHYAFIEKNKQQFNMRNRFWFEKLRSLYVNPPDVMTEKGRFISDITQELRVMYETLCWQLKISSDNDAAILNCEYQLANIGCESFSEDVSQGMEAYKLLRIECGKIIGTLPKVDSIQEIFQLKEKRRQDLHNLRQELSRLEEEIRLGNSEKAIEMAAKDLSKASKALSRGNYVSQVTKWTNFFSIPLAAASLFLENPRMTIGAGVLSVIGKTTTFLDSTIRERNKWFEIII